jgi:hypothetical protein
MSVPPPPPRRRAHVDDVTASHFPPPPVEPSSRAARRASGRDAKRSSGRGRILLILSVVLAVALIGVGVLIATGSDDKEDEPPQVDRSTSVELSVNPVGFDSTNAYATLDDFPRDVADGLRGALEAYVDLATVTPARKGAVVKDADLGTIFDQGAVARIIAMPPDRDVLLDEGLPKATGRVQVKALPIDLYGLAEADGKVVLVTAVLTLGNYIEEARAGSIVYAPQSDGSWKITAWTLHVERSGPGVTAVTPTTVPTAPTSASTTSTSVAQ